MEIQSNLYTTAEAAVYLRCSSATIYALIRHDKIEALKRGRCYLILRSSLDDYLEVGFNYKK